MSPPLDAVQLTGSRVLQTTAGAHHHDRLNHTHSSNLNNHPPGSPMASINLSPHHLQHNYHHHQQQQQQALQQHHQQHLRQHQHHHHQQQHLRQQQQQQQQQHLQQQQHIQQQQQQQQYYLHQQALKLKKNVAIYDCISIKSKIGVEFRRYSLKREDVQSYESFHKKIESFHQLSAIPFVISYTDSENFLLPINNNDNLAKAISSAKYITLQGRNCINNNKPAIIKRPLLKLLIEKKGTFMDHGNHHSNGKYKKHQPFKGFSSLILPNNEQGMRPSIGMPEDFRQVSSIIDDVVTCRRVKIVKHGSGSKPLGFFIQEGTCRRSNAQGQSQDERGIFISRIVEGGLAESTGLLAVGDEVLEVNGIQVSLRDKTLEQVTDMMVANSSNLILTIRPTDFRWMGFMRQH